MNNSFRNWKTTIPALITAICLLLAQFGVIELSLEAQGALATIALVLIGFFAKDAGNASTNTETLTIEKEISSKQS
jgi:hypothetical protein